MDLAQTNKPLLARFQLYSIVICNMRDSDVQPQWNNFLFSNKNVASPIVEGKQLTKPVSDLGIRYRERLRLPSCIESMAFQTIVMK